MPYNIGKWYFLSVLSKISECLLNKHLHDITQWINMSAKISYTVIFLSDVNVKGYCFYRRSYCHSKLLNVVAINIFWLKTFVSKASITDLQGMLQNSKSLIWNIPEVIFWHFYYRSFACLLWVNIYNIT